MILAGGAARRLGGRDKPGLLVGGARLLDHAVAACAGARRIVVVGPERPTVIPVAWVREDPPGGGPVAALAAGLAAVSAPVTLLLAADLPFVTREVTERLVAALSDPAMPDDAETPHEAERGALAAGSRATASGVPSTRAASSAGTDGSPERAAAAAQDAAPRTRAPAASAATPTAAHVSPAPDAVLLTDSTGRDQPLLAVYRTEALRKAVAAVGDPDGAPLRRVWAGLRASRMADPGRAAFDCDTWPQVRAARATSGRMENVLEDWIEAVKAELGIELDVDIAALLDMTKVAAHNVVRPAAPLTAFLVGYAAAQAGGGSAAVADALRKAEALAAAYERPDAESGGADTGGTAAP